LEGELAFPFVVEAQHIARDGILGRGDVNIATVCIGGNFIPVV